MKIRVQREPFLKGCLLADLVFPRRPVEPGFQRILLQARESTCAVYAVGNEVALRLEIPAMVTEAGEAMLPARHALAVVRQTAADELTLESAEGHVRTQGERAEFLLETPGPAHYPAIGSVQGGACHLIPADLLCQAVRRTLFAVGRQTAHYSLQAVLWEVEPDQIRLVGTDTKRLAVAELPAQTAEEHMSCQQWLLAARAMDLLVRLAEGQQESI